MYAHKLHKEILDEHRAKIFLLLRKFRSVGYLAGGTALALQLGHRYSYDFDIFCDREISNKLLRTCKEVFQMKQVLVQSVDEFSFLTSDNIKLTFLYYPFSFPGKSVATESLPMLSIANIAASKAYALNRRGTYRDYVDLYCILQDHMSLKSVMNRAVKIYGALFTPKLFLGQLVYMDDLTASDIHSVRTIGPRIPKDKLKRFFQQQVRSFQKEIYKK
ncbi:MAG: nucleotidyl transferase AbiEii/AbiGii toxin family protein [Deltaproteobacteria bacterium]|nr:nucleotidyl transferase AbiEii/AbiGii toxin family protein [Deltaproteobacteria bacterium]